jgi:hypothetical protein
MLWVIWFGYKVVDFQVSGSDGSWLITTTMLSLAGSALTGATVGLIAGTAVGAADTAGADAAALGAAAAGAESESSEVPQATTNAITSKSDVEIRAKRLNEGLIR